MLACIKNGHHVTYRESKLILQCRTAWCLECLCRCTTCCVMVWWKVFVFLPRQGACVLVSGFLVLAFVGLLGSTSFNLSFGLHAFFESCYISSTWIFFSTWNAMRNVLIFSYWHVAEDGMKPLHLVLAVLTKILILPPLLEPPCFLKGLTDTVFPNTSKLRLECTFTGAPKLFVTWYKDGKQLYASYRYNTSVTENSCMLECLHECNEETPGKYSCEISNSFGTDICHANVTTETGLYNFGFLLYSTSYFINQLTLPSCLVIYLG